MRSLTLGAYGNGEIVASGEGSTTKAKAPEGVDVLKRESAGATVEDLT